MTKRAAWVVNAVVGALTVCLLVWVATFRFAVPPVSPPPPPRDYALQAGIAISGCIAVFIGFGLTAVGVARSEQRRSSITIWGCVAMVGIGIVAAILALAVPG